MIVIKLVKPNHFFLSSAQSIQGTDAIEHFPRFKREKKQSKSFESHV